MHDKRATAAYVETFGRQPSSGPVPPKVGSPEFVMTGRTAPYKSSWHKKDLNYVLKALDNQVKQAGFEIPYKADPVRSALVWRFLKIALRDTDEDPQAYCPVCRAYHTIPVTVPCPAKPDDHPQIRAVVPNIKAEQNAIMAGAKILDKLFPNLGAVSATVNVQGTITTVSAELIKIIVEYVPPDKRTECYERIDSMLGQIQSSGEPQ